MQLYSVKKLEELIAKCAEAEGLAPSEVFWNDFASWTKGEGIDGGLLQKSLRARGGFNRLRDAKWGPAIGPEAREGRSAQLAANDNRKLSRHVMAELQERETIENFAKRLFKGKTATYKKARPSRGMKRTQCLILSDNHLGADIRGDETGSTDYGVVEESRRLARVVVGAADFKSRYRDESELVVLMLGDHIENCLHDRRTGAPVAIQKVRAMHSFYHALAYLATAYPKVTVYGTSGNHGRDVSRHKERAIQEKFDSHETVIFYSLKMALAKFENVSFHIPTTPWIRTRMFSHNIYAAHGDTNMSGHGYIGNAVMLQKIEQAVNKVNANREPGQRDDVVIVGHSHCPVKTTLSNGVVFINNGATKPLDSHVASMNRSEVGNCSQTIFESTEAHAVGDYRELRVGQRDDRDSSLDKIIPTWSGL